MRRNWTKRCSVRDGAGRVVQTLAEALQPWLVTCGPGPIILPCFFIQFFNTAWPSVLPFCTLLSEDSVFFHLRTANYRLNVNRLA